MSRTIRTVRGVRAIRDVRFLDWIFLESFKKYLGMMSIQIVNFPFQMNLERLEVWRLINNYYHIKFTELPGKVMK